MPSHDPEPEHGLVVEQDEQEHEVTALVVHEPPAVKLASLERQKGIARALISFVDQNGLSVNIQGKKYLKVEAWQFISHQFNCVPRTLDVEYIRNPNTGELDGYRATVELVNVVTGDAFGPRAIAECWLDEKMGSKLRWTDKYAACSMSQTRATSKACSQAFRPIAIMGNYEGTPSEEMEGVKLEERPAQKPKPSAPVGPITDENFPHDKPVGFGKHKDRTWGEMFQGEVGGQRDEWLRWLHPRLNMEKERDRGLKPLVEFCLKKLHGEDCLDEQKSVDEDDLGPKTRAEAYARWTDKAKRIGLSDKERDHRWKEAFQRLGMESSEDANPAQLSEAWRWLASWIPEEAEGQEGEPDWTDEGEQYRLREREE